MSVEFIEDIELRAIENDLLDPLLLLLADEEGCNVEDFLLWEGPLHH